MNIDDRHKASLADKFEGCLLGLALGDCLGASWEGYRGTEVAEAYYDDRFDPINLRISEWTDDTAMAMATAQSIVDTGMVDGADLAAKYLAWFESGGRGIGRATYHSMRRLQSGTPWNEAGQKGEYATSNGVAMRIAPVGLFHACDISGLAEDCRICGIITHRNEDAIAGAVAVAHAVATAAAGELSIDTLAVQMSSVASSPQVSSLILRAGELVEVGQSPLAALSELGLGGSVYETVPTVVYCIMRWPDDPVKGLVSAVVNGGDTDTRAAMVGAIWGAQRGASAWPDYWLDELPGGTSIREVARQLYHVAINK